MKPLSHRHLLVSLSALICLAASPGLAQSDDSEEGMGSSSLIVSGYDAKSGKGLLEAVFEDGNKETLMSRAGEVPRRIYDLDHEFPVHLVIWKKISGPPALSPEIWTHQGYANLAWGGLPRVVWQDAQVVVRPGKSALEAWVTRSLMAENQSPPMLRAKEQYLVKPAGLKLKKQVLSKIKTPDQRLNWISELGHQGELAKMVQQVRKLPRKPVKYMQRAAILMTKFGTGTRLAGQASKILELLASESRSPEVASAAADRLLEMAWEQARKGAKK